MQKSNFIRLCCLIVLSVVAVADTNDVDNSVHKDSNGDWGGDGVLEETAGPLSFKEKVLLRALLQKENSIEHSSELRQNVHKLEKLSDWDQFEKDLWYIVKPLKFILYIALIGLLAILGILWPILKLFFNVILQVLRVINSITRNLLYPVLRFFIESTLVVVKYIKIALEFCFNLVVEPTWRYIISPTLAFIWKYRNANMGIFLILGGALAVAWATVIPPDFDYIAFAKHPDMDALRHFAHFADAHVCMGLGPSTVAETLQYPAAFVAFLGGCALTHSEAVLAAVAFVCGLLAIFHGCAVMFHIVSFKSGANLVLLPSRAVLLLIAFGLAVGGVAFVTQSFARIVGLDIGVDMMYLEVFHVEPLEASLIEMEFAGALEVTLGAGLLSIAGRLAAVAVAWDLMTGHFDQTRIEQKDPNSDFAVVAFTHMLAHGLFWAALPLIRGMLAGRLGASLTLAGASGLLEVGQADKTVHFGLFTMFILGALALARACSIIGPYFGVAALKDTLAWVWRPLLGLEFLLCAYLFGDAVVDAASELRTVQLEPSLAMLTLGVPVVASLLCCVGTLAIAGLTLGKPAVAWRYGDIVLANMDLGVLSVLRKIYNVVVDTIVVPVFMHIVAPILLFVYGIVALLMGRLWLAFIFLYVSFCSPFFQFLLTIYANPLTALPASGGAIYLLFKIHTGAVPLPWWLVPTIVGHWTVAVAFEFVSLALAAVLTHVVSPAFAAAGFVSGHVMEFLAFDAAWTPTLSSITAGSIFRDTQFALRVYGGLLTAGLVWRHLFERDSKKFYAAFKDLKVPNKKVVSKKAKKQIKAITTYNSIAPNPNPVSKKPKQKKKGSHKKGLHKNRKKNN